MGDESYFGYSSDTVNIVPIGEWFESTVTHHAVNCNLHFFKSSQSSINNYRMNYNKIYKQLIDKRKANPVTNGYKENHHILPKSLGGDNYKENLVLLTGREHWIAHLLLHKIYKRPETVHACHMMAMRCDERGIPRIRNSRMYEWARIQCLKHWSKSGKKRIGEKNGSYGTMWICNIELKQNKKIKTDEDIPDGWIKGRNKWKPKWKPKTNYKENERIEATRTKYNQIYLILIDEYKNYETFQGFLLGCNLPKKINKKLFKKYVKNYDSKYLDYFNDTHKNRIEKLYNKFKDGKYTSVREFHRENNLDITIQNLCRQFKNHIPEYTQNVKRCKSYGNVRLT